MASKVTVTIFKWQLQAVWQPWLMTGMTCTCWCFLWFTLVYIIHALFVTLSVRNTCYYNVLVSLHLCYYEPMVEYQKDLFTCLVNSIYSSLALSPLGIVSARAQTAGTHEGCSSFQCFLCELFNMHSSFLPHDTIVMSVKYVQTQQSTVWHATYALLVNRSPCPTCSHSPFSPILVLCYPCQSNPNNQTLVPHPTVTLMCFIQKVFLFSPKIHDNWEIHWSIF